ncbi:hypothetical protein BC830DRAFT_1174300 [Chytriomyces sp. MP71]|nr:hypothetical protein BC830DRAFT_1174300 [Chytriomyces sp. MP71]
MTCCFSTTTNNPSQWKAWLNASIVLSDTVSPGHQDYLSITFTPPPTGFFNFDAPIVIGAKSNIPAPCRPVNASGNAWVCAAYGTSSNLGFDFLIDVASALPPGTMPSISQMLLFSSNSTSLDEAMNEAGDPVSTIACMNPPDEVSKCPSAPTSLRQPTGGTSTSGSSNRSSGTGLSTSTITLIAIFVGATVLAIAIVAFFRARNKGVFTKMSTWWSSIATDDVPHGARQTTSIAQPVGVEALPAQSTSSQSLGNSDTDSVEPVRDSHAAAKAVSSRSKPTDTPPVTKQTTNPTVQTTRVQARRAAINPLAYNRALQPKMVRQQRQQPLQRQQLYKARPQSPNESISTSVFSVADGITTSNAVPPVTIVTPPRMMDEDDDDIPLHRMKII